MGSEGRIMLVQFLLGLALAFVALSAQAAQKRLALLIGDHDYPSDLGRLSNTHADGRAVGDALKDRVAACPIWSGAAL